MEVVAGIDGGGTKTLVALSDLEGRIVGIGRGGPSNINDVGLEKAQASIAEALQKARAEARAWLNINSAFFGIAGVVSADDRTLVEQIAENLQFPNQIAIDHDCRVALAGALSGRPGIVLIAGTGSSCFGMNAEGRGWRSGGWGYLISDEGSSYWLGREALVKVARALDGRDPATLLQNLLEVLGVSDPHKLIYRLYIEGLSRSELAALAPEVIKAAELGDRAARGLLEQGARLLVECVEAVAAQLNLPDNTELAVVGGLTKAGNVFWQPLKAALFQNLPNIRLTEPELPPVLGAIVCALGSNQGLSETALQNLKQSALSYRDRL